MIPVGTGRYATVGGDNATIKCKRRVGIFCLSADRKRSVSINRPHNCTIQEVLDAVRIDIAVTGLS